MYRHFSARLLRFDRSASDARRGFTLVELLVVIAIIAMLVGLLIPAVNRAREAGRRAQCLNNQQQIGKAMINYVTEKNKFPPLFTLQPPSVAFPGPTAVGWVPRMLPLLEQNPLYQVFQQNTWNTLTNAEVPTLICPSRDPTYTPAPLSYIVNAGRTDVYLTSGAPLDYRENGVFFDDYAWQFTTLPTPRPPKPPVVDLAYLNKHDGNSKTLLLSENIDAKDWIAVAAAAGTMLQPVYPPDQNPVASWWQSLTWRTTTPLPLLPQKPGPAVNPDDWGFAGSFPTHQVLNKQPNVPPPLAESEKRDFYMGRPSSSHPGGFIVTMCDGHSQFMDEGIEYRVYCLLSAPDSANAKLPLNGNAVGYPGNWRSPPSTGMLIPVTAADIE